jgi:hypothetical protein
MEGNTGGRQRLVERWQQYKGGVLLHRSGHPQHPERPYRIFQHKKRDVPFA